MQLIIGLCVFCFLATIARAQPPFVSLRDLTIDDTVAPSGELKNITTSFM